MPTMGALYTAVVRVSMAARKNISALGPLLNGQSCGSVRRMSEIQKAAARLIKRHGGIRPAARASGIDPGYLYRLRHGQKTCPGPETLAALGLRSVYARARS